MSNYIVLPDGTKCYSGPNCLRHGKKSLPADFATKTREEQFKDLEKLNNPLSALPPKDVDDKIADLYDVYYTEIYPVQQIKAQIERLKKPYYASRPGNDERITKLEKEAAEQQAKAAAVLEEVVPYETEYSRRPWTRGFLVNNANGHVHKSTRCSTCTPTTRYLWLTEYSGQKEEELVADAGERACTVCYPSAPVDVLNRQATLNHPVLRASHEDKIAKQMQKEAKLAAQKEKQILTPTGEPLKDDSGYLLKTLITAENRVSELHAEKLAAENGLMTIYNQPFFDQRQASYATIMEAIAFKKGMTVEEAEADLAPKFARKYKNDWLSRN